MNNQIKAVIFDMGGVLLRSEDDRPRTELAGKFGVSREELEFFVFMSETSILSEIGEITDQEHWETVLRHFKQSVDKFSTVYDEFFAGDAIDEKLLAFAESLKPDYKIGLLSNAWVNARTLLGERYSFIESFDVSIFSYEVQCRKPDPEIYRFILERIGVAASESVFIDDMKMNVKGAQAVGMNAIRFTTRDEIIAALESLLNR